MPCLSSPEVSSQRERLAERFLSKAFRLRKRLGGTGDAFSFGSKPKGMHQRTYKRLIVELQNLRWAFYSCLAVQFRFKGFEDPDALEEEILGTGSRDRITAILPVPSNAVACEGVYLRQSRLLNVKAD
jgi:hypothetical protein